MIIIGLNPIAIYMAYRMVNFKYTSEFLLTGIMSISGEFAEVVLYIGILGLELLLLFFYIERRYSSKCKN